ncbi:MAG: SGNH/GDSL hydrolase family protein [Candidatus Eisenbacteria bacterium]
MLLVVLLAMPTAELATRLVLHAKYGVPGKSLGRWESDPVLGARMARSVYDHRMETNDHGFRGPEDVIDPRPEGALRIIAYGGSTTLCWNLSEEETWPRRLEARIRQDAGRAESQVLNAGDINWSIGHAFARARTEVPALRPDYVVLYSGINEVVNSRLLEAEGLSIADLVERGEYGRIARNSPQASWWARHSFVYRAFQGRVLRPLTRLWQERAHDPWYERQRQLIGPKSPALPPDPALLENYEHVLVEFIDFVKANGGKFVFVVQARGWDSVALEHFTSYSRAAAPIAAAHGAIVIDAEAALPPDPEALFYESGIHFSADGADWFAGFVYEEVFAERSDEE